MADRAQNETILIPLLKLSGGLAEIGTPATVQCQQHPLSGLEIASLLGWRGGQRLLRVVDLVQHPLLKCHA